MTRRVLIATDPFAPAGPGNGWDWADRAKWPCKWVGCADAPAPPFVAAYRLRFSLDRPAVIRAHVSADERYDLYVDGALAGRGPERGDPENWFYETYDLDLAPGDHVVVAKTWAQGEKAAFAQFSVRPGFLFATEKEWTKKLGTGNAPWEARLVDGYTFISPEDAWGTGWNIDVDGARYPWGIERGAGDGWKPAVVQHEAVNGFITNEVPAIQMLKPATLPAQLDVSRKIGKVRLAANLPAEPREAPVRAVDNIPAEAAAWGTMLAGRGTITVPANTGRRILVDLEDYYCGRPELTVSGGAGSVVRVMWEEALYEAGGKADEWVRSRPKGNRNEVEGKIFVGVGDVFRPDGGSNRLFTTLWWQAGRYVEMHVTTGADPLVVSGFVLRETGYPLEMESSFEASDPRLASVIPIAFRTLRMCAHETYMDCPYYEQLMYVGDTRLEAKTTLLITKDDRLPRKALTMFDVSRLTWGLTQSRYPSRMRQVIPPFSLWWVGMVFDHALWRGDREFIKTLMPGVRGVLDYFRSRINADGLVEAPNGWNYMDWVPAWGAGVPPDGATGVSGLINWQFVQILTRAADLERFVGEPELAERNLKLATEHAMRLAAAFWDPGRSLFADDLAHKHFSEHSQCLAVIGGRIDADKRSRIAEALFKDPDLARTTIYFSNYLFETYRLLGRVDAMLDRMKLWFDLKPNGFRTTLESPEPSRSDCHAWGAHPVYHYFASILGIRPAGMGSSEYVIEPMLGPLEWAKGKLVQPRGTIELEVRRDGTTLSGRAVLPAGMSGTIMHGGQSKMLIPGTQEFRLG